MSHGDAANYLASLAPEGREFTEAQVKAGVDLGEQAKQEIEKVTAFKIIEKQAISDNEVVLTVYASGVNEAVRFKMQRFGNDWKFAGPIKDKGQASTK
jgi:hypothetical protein